MKLRYRCKNIIFFLFFSHDYFKLIFDWIFDWFLRKLYFKNKENIYKVKFADFVRNMCARDAYDTHNVRYSRDKNDRHILRDVRLTVGFLTGVSWSMRDILSPAW